MSVAYVIHYAIYKRGFIVPRFIHRVVSSRTHRVQSNFGRHLGRSRLYPPSHCWPPCHYLWPPCLNTAQKDGALGALEPDLKGLLASWFDVGFLELRRITWNAPATLLEKLIAYEAVHAIRSWEDLKDRLDALRRGVREPVEPLDPGAVAQVEIRHRVQRPAVAAFFLGQVTRAKPHQYPAHGFRVGLVLLPSGRPVARRQAALTTPAWPGRVPKRGESRLRWPPMVREIGAAYPGLPFNRALTGGESATLPASE